MTEEELARLFGEKSGLEVTAEVGAVLARLLAEARAAWPKITVTPARFIEHVAVHAPTLDALRTLRAGELYLACGVSQGDRAALAAFEERYMANVPDYVLRVRAGRDFIDDVQQKMREQLMMGSAPKIATYSGRGALGGWLRVMAVRTALNHVRATSAPTEELGDEVSLGADPELALVKAHGHRLFADAFKRVLGELDAKERSILRLHYIEGLTMDQLAQAYKTPRSTIARRVAEARQQILEATEALLTKERNLSPSAIASVIRLARSQLDLTITRLFDENPEP